MRKIISITISALFLFNSMLYAATPLSSQKEALRVPIARDYKRVRKVEKALLSNPVRKISRRRFVRLSAITAGGLVFGLAVSKTAEAMTAIGSASVTEELTADFLIKLTKAAKTDKEALNKLLGIVPKLEELVKSDGDTKEIKKIRYIAFDILFKLYSHPGSFAFSYDTESMIQIFERLVYSMIRLMDEGVTVQDPGKRYHYSHLEWFAERGHLFAIQALIHVYKTEKKDTRLWYKAAIPLNRILMNHTFDKDINGYIYLYDVISPLLTPDTALRKQLKEALFEKRAQDQHEFIIAHPEFAYLILRSGNNKELLDKVRTDENIPAEVRIYALGLSLSLISDEENKAALMKEMLEKEGWYDLAKEFITKDVISPAMEGKPKSARDMFKGNFILSQSRLSAYVLAAFLNMDTNPLLSREEAITEVVSHIMWASFDVFSERTDEAFTISTNRLNENPILFLATWPHEITHNLLNAKGFGYFGELSVAAMQEFLCDTASFKFLKQNIENPGVLDKLVKKLRLKYGYGKCLEEWNELGVEGDFESMHNPARAFLEKIITEHPEGVDWVTLFAIGAGLANEMKKELFSDMQPYTAFAGYASEAEKLYSALQKYPAALKLPFDKLFLTDKIIGLDNLEGEDDISDEYWLREDVVDIVNKLESEMLKDVLPRIYRYATRYRAMFNLLDAVPLKGNTIKEYVNHVKKIDELKEEDGLYAEALTEKERIIGVFEGVLYTFSKCYSNLLIRPDVMDDLLLDLFRRDGINEYEDWMINKLAPELKNSLDLWKADPPHDAKTWQDADWQDALIRSVIGIAFQDRYYAPSSVETERLNNILVNQDIDRGDPYDFFMGLAYAVNIRFFSSDILKIVDSDIAKRHQFYAYMQGPWEGGQFGSVVTDKNPFPVFKDGRPYISGCLFSLQSELSHYYAYLVLKNKGLSSSGLKHGEIVDRLGALMMLKQSPFLTYDDSQEYVYSVYKLGKEVLLNESMRGEVLSKLENLTSKDKNLEISVSSLTPYEIYYLGLMYIDKYLPFDSDSKEKIASIKGHIEKLGIPWSGFQEEVTDIAGILAYSGRGTGFRLADNTIMKPYDKYTGYLFAERLSADFIIQVILASKEAGITAKIQPYIIGKAVKFIIENTEQSYVYDWRSVVKTIEKIDARKIRAWLEELIGDGVVRKGAPLSSKERKNIEEIYKNYLRIAEIAMSAPLEKTRHLHVQRDAVPAFSSIGAYLLNTRIGRSVTGNSI